MFTRNFIVCFTMMFSAAACEDHEFDEDAEEEEDERDWHAAGDDEPGAEDYFADNELGDEADDIDNENKVIGKAGRRNDDLGAMADDGSSDGSVMEIGVADDAAFLSPHMETRALAFQTAKDLQATVIRSWVYWGMVMDRQNELRCPADGSGCYSLLQKLDRFVDEATGKTPVNDHEFKVELTLTGVVSPSLKDGKPSFYGCPEDDHEENCGRGHIAKLEHYEEFGKFVHTIVEHFVDRGVYRFSIWNEPNEPKFLKSENNNGATYVELYRKGRIEAFKAYRTVVARREMECHLNKRKCEPLPPLEILFGELSAHSDKGGVYPLRFMENVEERILKKRNKYKGRRYNVRAEGLALHPYQHHKQPGEPDPEHSPGGIGSLYDIQWMLAKMHEKKALRTRNGRPLPLHLTEFGYFRSTPACDDTCLRPDADLCHDRERAEWTDVAFSLARSQNAKQMLYYMLFSPDQCPSSSEFWDTSLFPSEGDMPPPGNTPLCPSGWHSHRVDWPEADLYDSPCEEIQGTMPQGTIVCMRSIPAEVACGNGWSLVYRPAVDSNTHYWARTEAFDGH
jgi:hypothetical protein